MKLDLFSHAKLNLVLDFLYKREDGYHETEFIMQELELQDKMTFEENDNLELNCSNPIIWTDERNLIIKTAKLLQEEFSCTKGAKIFLEKNIPLTGGLGGFSVNVATTIKALNNLWELKMTQEKMIEIATKIGMDCAFPIIGGTCLATGRGEILKKIKSPVQLDILIITPKINVPENKTKWIYSNFDVTQVKKHPSVKKMIDAIKTKNKNHIAQCIGNAFEQGLTIPEYKPVFELITELKKQEGVLNVALAGSGPTVFAIIDNEINTKKLSNKFKKRFDKVFITKTI